MNSLKHCPFCGSNEVRLFQADLDQGSLFFVSCDDCDAEGPSDPKANEAEQRWNKRID